MKMNIQAAFRVSSWKMLCAEAEKMSDHEKEREARVWVEIKHRRIHNILAWMWSASCFTLKSAFSYHDAENYTENVNETLEWFIQYEIRIIKPQKATHRHFK